MAASRADVALNIFGKPYQTSLALLSLLRFSRPHIGTIYLQFEPYGSAFDPAPPYVAAEYLQELPDAPSLFVSQPKYWLKLDPPEMPRLNDPEYRLSIRYQHAFEHSTASHMLILHNDVLILRDMLGYMLKHIGDAFALGGVGQCWNCPARHAFLMREAGCGSEACAPERYVEFQPDPAGLDRLYRVAVNKGVFVRPWWEGWQTHYNERAWPLPECRVNEWGCLVNLELTRPLVLPHGSIMPFGAFEACGSIALDTAVAWFRDLNRLGLRARHMDIQPYLTHWVGNGKMTRIKYLRAEENARIILERQFPAFAQWCRRRGNGLFV